MQPSSTQYSPGCRLYTSSAKRKCTTPPLSRGLTMTMSVASKLAASGTAEEAVAGEALTAGCAAGSGRGADGSSGVVAGAMATCGAATLGGSLTIGSLAPSPFATPTGASDRVV